MCHADQKLSGDVVKHGQGAFRPSAGQALVGGSYVLFDEQVVVADNVKMQNTPKNGDEWQRIRCICGATVGGCEIPTGGVTTVYRFAKYAMRPISLSSNLVRPPLSAFIVADMIELVQAHAINRFVIRDEEDEKVRIMIWLFNPSVRLSHAHPKPYVLAKSGVAQVAKVFYKLVGPSETISPNGFQVTNPQFCQAEHLYYPMSICHSLAMLLRESNRTYPPACRTMSGANGMSGMGIAWLEKA